jgi:hypothetical protein
MSSSGFEGVHRTIAIRDDLTLVDLHYALQSAFDWDDDHLYAFWLKGAFWSTDCEHYLHPLHAQSDDSLCKSAHTPLVELGLAVGHRIAYVFDSSGGSGSPSSVWSPPAVAPSRRARVRRAGAAAVRDELGEAAAQSRP